MSGDQLRLLGDEVSTANPRWAFAKTKDNSCTFSFGYFLRRSTPTSSDWKVITDEQDSAQYCSYYLKRLPRDIVAEFQVTGLEGKNLNSCVSFLTASGPSVVTPGAKVSFSAGGFTPNATFSIGVDSTTTNAGIQLTKVYRATAAGVAAPTLNFPKAYYPCLQGQCSQTVPLKPGQAVNVFICPSVGGACAVRRVRIK